MGLEFGFPYGSSRFFDLSFRANSQASIGGSLRFSELLNGLKLTCSVLTARKATQWSSQGPPEQGGGSSRLKIRHVDSFRGGFCRLRTRGSSVISTRIGQGGGNVISKTRCFRLKGLGDRRGAGKGFEIEASTKEGDGLFIDVSAGIGQTSSNGRCGAGVGAIIGGIGGRVRGVSAGFAAAGVAGEEIELISRKSSVKRIVKHIKAANGVVKGVKAATGVLEGLKTTPEDVLLLVGSENRVVVIMKAAKFVVKGVKVSKGVATALKAFGEKFGGRWSVLRGAGPVAPLVERVKVLSVVVKKMKAPAAALKIVKITMGVGKDLGQSGVSELLNWSTLRKGYKFSKCALTVFEVVTSVKGGMVSMAAKGVLGAKGAVEGVGVMMKALWLSREVYVVILKGVAMWKGAYEAFLAISRKQKAAQASPCLPGSMVHQLEATATDNPVSSFYGNSRKYEGLPLRLDRLAEKRCTSFGSESVLALLNTETPCTPVSSFEERLCLPSGDQNNYWSLFLLAFPV